MDDQTLNKDAEKLRRLEEALSAGLACARECPLNTTYHERVMNAALTGLRAELPEQDGASPESRGKQFAPASGSATLPYTAEKPKRDGWWWFLSAAGRTLMVRITWGGTQGEFHSENSGSWTETLATSAWLDGGWWAGPLLALSETVNEQTSLND